MNDTNPQIIGSELDGDKAAHYGPGLSCPNSAPSSREVITMRDFEDDNSVLGQPARRKQREERDIRRTCAHCGERIDSSYGVESYNYKTEVLVYYHKTCHALVYGS